MNFLRNYFNKLGFELYCCYLRASQVALATHSSILAWKIPWTEEPGGYSPQSPKS